MSEHAMRMGIHLKNVKEQEINTKITSRTKLQENSNNEIDLYENDFDFPIDRLQESLTEITIDGCTLSAENGTIVFKTNSMAQTIEAGFSKLHQIIHIGNKTAVAIGSNKENKLKIMELDIIDGLLKYNDEFYKKTFIKDVQIFHKNSLYFLVEFKSEKSQLIQYDFNSVFTKVHTIELDETIGNHSAKVIVAFGNKIVIGFRNKIILCNELTLELKNTIPGETESSKLGAMIQIKDYLILFYKNNKIYILNAHLELVGESYLPFIKKKQRLVKCHLLSNDTLCFAFTDEKTSILTFFNFEIYENGVKEYKQCFQINETNDNIQNIYTKLKECQTACRKEKQYSEKRFQEILEKPVKDELSVALITLKDILLDYGSELILCSDSNVNNDTYKLHASILFNGFLSRHSSFYCMQFQVEDLHFVDMKNSNEANAKFCNEFRNFIHSITDIPKEEIIILNIHNRDITMDFKFRNNILHDKFDEKIKNIEDFDPYLKNAFSYVTKLISLKTDYTIKRFLLNEKIFNFQYNRRYDHSFYDTRGKFPYYPPVGWMRLGLNIEYFGYKNSDDWIQMDKRHGEWAIAYHGIRTRPLETFYSILTDSSGKPTLKVGPRQACSRYDNLNSLNNNIQQKCDIGVYCSPNIEEAEGYTTSIPYGDKTTKIALMCRVNPKALLMPSNNVFIIPSSDDIRPYGLLLKIQ